MLSFFATRFSPLRSRLFATLFVCQFFSNTGSWAFEIARTWIIVDRLGKGHEVGAVMLAGGISALVFTLYGGFLVDRFNFRQVLWASIFAKILLFALSIWLFFIVEFQSIALWHLVVFSFFQGVIVAFDAPAFFSFVVKLVPTQDLQQAIALNQMNFQASRTVGPLLAGLLMGIHGPSLVILFDGLSFLGPAIATFFVLREKSLPAMSANTKSESRGFHILLRDPKITGPLIQLFLCLSFFLPTILVTFRIYIKEMFHVTPEKFSYIFMGPALGSLIGAMTFAMIKPKNPMKWLYLGIPLFVTTTVAIPFFESLSITVLWMSLGGFAAFFSFSALTVHLQLYIQEGFRGRLTSMILLGFSVIMPMAAYPIGKLIDHYSAGFCLITIPCFFLIFSGPFWMLNLKKRHH